MRPPDEYVEHLRRVKPAVERVDAPSRLPAASPWYALWTRSRHERQVRDELQRKGVEAFLPTIARWSRWKDRRKRVDWPLFPGYCFARVDPTGTRPLLTCGGVVAIVSFDGRPAPIDAHEIESIRVLVDTDWRFDPCPLIHEGMLVEIVSGPLLGIVGRLVRKNELRARLVLAVAVIGQALTIEVDAADVRPC